MGCLYDVLLWGMRDVLFHVENLLPFVLDVRRPDNVDFILSFNLIVIFEIELLKIVVRGNRSFVVAVSHSQGLLL